jgi:hypothetical protein
MERIEGLLPDQRETAELVLQWVARSQKKLSTQELQHALAVEIGESFKTRLQQYPLYNYAIQNWEYHARLQAAEERMALDFLETEEKISACAQAPMSIQKRKVGEHHFHEQQRRAIKLWSNYC